MGISKVTVVGMGYVGMTAALGAAHRGHNVICVGPLDPETGNRDTRSTALFPDSVALLRELDVWKSVEHASRPLKGIRIVDGSDAIFRAPEITFRADECGLDALAMNVPNRVLQHALATRIRETIAADQLYDATVDTAHSGAKSDSVAMQMKLSDGSELQSDCTIAADGRGSLLRDAAKITLKRWSYDQVALACTIHHSAPHDDISTEFHRRVGPLTIVPGAPSDTGATSHLVWIETADAAQRMMELDEAGFRARLHTALHGLLGTIHKTGARGSFPINGQTATSFASSGVFLVGESAHVLPPIGAQGMNLGLRDVQGVLDALESAPDIETVARLYNDDRRNDVFVRTTAVDLLNRSLTTPYWPVRTLRGAGLHMLNMVPPLKRAAIHAGFGN